MNKKPVILLFFLLLTIPVFATWSIIVYDPETKKIGMAGASCTYSVYGIGGIIPGKGAIIVQAMSSPFARSKGLKMLMNDDSPQSIMEAMKHPDFEPEEQQYAILSVKYAETPLTFSGDDIPGFKGSLTSKNLSVQGNTLASATVLKAVYDTALQAIKDGKSIEEILMLAMEAGSDAGGDSRCGEQRASSAFLTVAKSSDDRQHPYLNLVIYGNDEEANAVKALRKKFNGWKKKKN